MRDAKLQFRFGQGSGSSLKVGFNDTSVGTTIAGIVGATSATGFSAPLLLGGYTNVVADATQFVGNAVADQPASNGLLLWGHNNRNQMYVHSAVQVGVASSSTVTMIVEGSNDSSTWAQVGASEASLTAVTGTTSTATLSAAAATGVLTSGTHGFSVGDVLIVDTVGTAVAVGPPGATAAAVTQGQVYVVTSVPSATTFTIGLGPGASYNGVYTAASLLATVSATCTTVFRKCSSGVMLQAAIAPSSRTYYRVRYVTTGATTQLMVLNAYVKNGRDGASF